jgi:hypothetical protein
LWLDLFLTDGVVCCEAPIKSSCNRVHALCFQDFICKTAG